MIRTKEAQIVDAQNGYAEVVYFHVSHDINNRQGGTRIFNIVTSVLVTNENNQSQLNHIKEVKAVFKESTFKKLFGSLTSIEFDAQIDALMIEQIDYINSLAPVEGVVNNKFWSLTSEDLEVVTI